MLCKRSSVRCGIISVDKPAGITSRKVVDRVAKIVKPAKAGHAGTLDPLATGVLVVCVGAATRLMPLIHEAPKSYRVQFLLGRRSDTDDLEGEVVFTENSRRVERAEIESLIPRFLGEIEQVPPAFSAVHVDGRRAYELARKGQTVELAPRKVTVHRLTLERFEYPEVEFEIECSSGTYIRSIGRDMGELLGCGALMSSLVRTRVGPFSVETATPFDDLVREKLDDVLHPARTATSHLPERTCTPEELELVRRGRPISWSTDQMPSTGTPADGSSIAILCPDGILAALAELQPNNVVQPRTVLLDQS